MNISSVAIETVPVSKFRMRVRGPVKLVVKADPIERAEFEPDNSRIGCESLGLQTGKIAAQALFMSQFDYAARLMVAEHLDLVKFGLAPIVPRISLTLL